LQYSCENDLTGLRDGYPSGAVAEVEDGSDFSEAKFQRNNNAGTNGIDESTKDDTEYGQHETFEMYNKECENRERNKGLYVADQKVKKNDARGTRQNPNGNRSGFECPEERDYYPYWHPTAWTDIAVQTSNATFCNYYQTQSENVMDRYACVMNEGKRPITEAKCVEAGGTWQKVPARGIPAPECKAASFSRDNHLGNTDVLAINEPTAASHVWKIPFLSEMFTRANWPLGSGVQSVPILGEGEDSKLCVFRLRYNITTNDYPSKKGFDSSGDTFFDHRYSCEQVDTSNGENIDDNQFTVEEAGCANVLTDGNRPRYNRPYVQPFNIEGTPKLSIALNTNQAGRTFQDRSHVIRIKKRPADVPNSATIWNLNNRGRRGNIVQSYPAVEYDFSPKNLVANRNDYLHIQFHGSDYNANRNPNNAEGWKYSDRFNIVQVEELNTQIPWSYETMVNNGQTPMFETVEEAKKFATLNQEDTIACKDYKAGENGEQNSKNNCGKLNAAPAHMDFGLKPLSTVGRGTYHYISTRNNNFSNRSQKATWQIEGLTIAEMALAGVGTVAVIGGVAAGGMFAFKKGYIKGFRGGAKI
jgi:hypothetical protein